MREHKINSLNNFICGYYSEKPDLCDKIIDHFKESPMQHPGYSGGEGWVREEVKKSTDVTFQYSNNELFYQYHRTILMPALTEYCKKYEYARANCDVVESSNIQYYKPGEAYFQWHTERSRKDYPSNNRHLVFLTYLNDVDDAGETEFYYQQIKVKPERGLTLIWGTDWNFTHRGISSPSQEKYIVTGWFSYI